MTHSVWYWLFFVLYVIFGSWWYYDAARPFYRNYGAHAFLIVLLFLLGLANFGSPVK